MSDSLLQIKDLYPFRSNYLEIGGQRMHYVDQGSGPPILMLHGNPTWSFYYRELIKELSKDYRVIAPDHIGCGLSDKPQRYSYTLKTHIDNLERLIDHLGLEQFTLAVHDWGGAIGFGYAMRHVANVARFVVFNSAAFFGRVPLSIAVCKLPVLGALAVRSFNAFARGAVHVACKNRSRMGGQVKAGYLLPYGSYCSRVAIHRFVQDIPMSRSHPSYQLIRSIDESLPRFRDRPMIIFWGMQDFCFNESFLNKWMRRFPDAQVHRFADAGHYVVEDAHERIMPLLRGFLDRTAS